MLDSIWMLPFHSYIGSGTPFRPLMQMNPSSQSYQQVAPPNVSLQPQHLHGKPGAGQQTASKNKAKKGPTPNQPKQWCSSSDVGGECDNAQLLHNQITIGIICGGWCLQQMNSLPMEVFFGCLRVLRYVVLSEWKVLHTVLMCLGECESVKQVMWTFELDWASSEDIRKEKARHEIGLIDYFMSDFINQASICY